MVGCIRVAARTNRKGTGEFTKAHPSTAFQNPDARRHSRNLQLVYWDRSKHYSNVPFNYKLKDFNSVWIIRAFTTTLSFSLGTQHDAGSDKRRRYQLDFLLKLIQADTKKFY